MNDYKNTVFGDDMRNVEQGLPIPKENYCDQPYVVITRDGAWLCVLTTGPGLESRRGQHVVATISKDHGKTWTSLIDIEPPSEHMSSWVTPLIVPSGRVYAFYCYDHDLESAPHGGWMVYRFSDDNGLNWSDRYRVPIRMTRQDRENATGGKRQFFWCIDKPVIVDENVFFAIPKLIWGKTLCGGEGWVIHSNNIIKEDNPEKIHWELLPEGDQGIYNADLGCVQEEQNLQVLSDGSLYMVFRTTIGHPAYTISNDQGRRWSIPQLMRYADGTPIKNPRACPRIWKTSNGKFLLWFHNNSCPGFGTSIVRNPVWVSGGVEVDGNIQWGQPEILLYSRDQTLKGMSYPDLIEEDGNYWITETQKMFAYVHHIDKMLLEAAWDQHMRAKEVKDALIYDYASTLKAGDSFEMPKLHDLDEGGFSIEMWVQFYQLERGIVLLDGFGQRKCGLRITLEDNSAFRWYIHDGQQNRNWFEIEGTPANVNVALNHRIFSLSSDINLLRTNRMHHLVLIVDGKSKIVSIMVDGRLCDGGREQIKGWGRLNPWIRNVNGERIYKVGENFNGCIKKLRVYNRNLLTSEAAGNYKFGLLSSSSD